MMLRISVDVNGTHITRDPGPIMMPDDTSTYCGRVYAIVVVDANNSHVESYEFNNYASQVVLLRCDVTGWLFYL